MPFGGLAQRLAGLGVEGGIQRQRAVTEVFKAMPLGSPRRQRQHRVLAIQRLNRRLFIHAEHCGVLRRIQVKANDVGRLLLKVRIVRGHVAPDPMRLEAMLAPHAGHHHVAHLQVRGELARAPVRHPGGRRVPCRLQYPRFELRREHRGDLAQVSAVETGDALLGKSSGPASHKTPAALDSLGGFIPRKTVREQQNQPRPPGIFRPIRPAVGSSSQFHTLCIRQGNRVFHGHNYSL